MGAATGHFLPGGGGDFVTFSNEGEAFFIGCFTVTDIYKAQTISINPELKLGQHLVDGRIVTIL